jgi:hypothetical protein
MNMGLLVDSFWRAAVYCLRPRALLIVAALMTPALVALVAERRFPHLERKRGGSLLFSAVWSAGLHAAGGLALVVSLCRCGWCRRWCWCCRRLIWGWLTYRVMAFDALADHASKDERSCRSSASTAVVAGHWHPDGYLGAAPSLVWASGTLFAAAFVILVPVAIWIYTLVFAFSSLWFAHYCLQALENCVRACGGAAACAANACVRSR